MQEDPPAPCLDDQQHAGVADAARSIHVDAFTIAATAAIGAAIIASIPSTVVPEGAAPAPTLALFFDTDRWRPWLQQASTLLDARERTRVARQQRMGDRDELALAYACHRLVLGRVLGLRASQVPLVRDALGKPCVEGDAVHTSLSHATGCVAVAVSKAGVVGIDVEPAARASVMASIAALVMHGAEAEALAGLGDDARAAALLALWVRKEALLKAAGIGLAREMVEFMVPPGRAVPLPAAGGGVRAGSAFVHMLDVGKEWCAAIACACAAAPVPMWVDPPGR